MSFVKFVIILIILVGTTMLVPSSVEGIANPNSLPHLPSQIVSPRTSFDRFGLPLKEDFKFMICMIKCRKTYVLPLNTCFKENIYYIRKTYNNH